jgi:leucine-zipper of insertion element IS481
VCERGCLSSGHRSRLSRDIVHTSRRWVITLVQRYLAEGEAGLAPRSRRPLRSPRRTPIEVEDEIVKIRKALWDSRPARRGGPLLRQRVRFYLVEDSSLRNDALVEVKEHLPNLPGV